MIIIHDPPNLFLLATPLVWNPDDAVSSNFVSSVMKMSPHLGKGRENLFLALVLNPACTESKLHSRTVEMKFWYPESFVGDILVL